MILAVGTDLSWAHEEHDAENITYTAAQLSLISQVAAAAKKPVILVQYTATPLDLTDILANKQIGAVLHVGQPSSTILGVGELIFGQTSPAGRTVQTIYPAQYAADVSIFDFNMRPGPSAFPRPDCKGGTSFLSASPPPPPPPPPPPRSLSCLDLEDIAVTLHARARALSLVWLFG